MAARGEFFSQPVTHLAYFGTVSSGKFHFSSNIADLADPECGGSARTRVIKGRCNRGLRNYEASREESIPTICINESR